MSPLVLPSKRFTVTATSATVIYTLPYDFLPTVAMVYFRGILALSNISGPLNAQWVVQTATTDTDIPNGPVLIGTARTTANRFFENIDLTQAGNGNVNSHFYGRVGLAVWSTSGVATAEALLVPSFRGN